MKKIACNALALNSDEKLQSFASTFESPQRNVRLDPAGIEDTPPPDPNSDSPYSTMKRHVDALPESVRCLSLWKLVCRWFYCWKKNGINVFSNGRVDHGVWSKNWIRLHRLPHIGLMNLNAYKILGGNFQSWMNLHHRFYGTRGRMMNLMMEGEQNYRKNYRAVFDKIGHTECYYERISSNEKKCM